MKRVDNKMNNKIFQKKNLQIGVIKINTCRLKKKNIYIYRFVVVVLKKGVFKMCMLLEYKMKVCY